MEVFLSLLAVAVAASCLISLLLTHLRRDNRRRGSGD